MKFTNLTDAQVRDIQAAITPLHDVVKEEAILKAFDILVGVVNGSSAAAVSDLADDVQTWHGHEMGFVKTLSDNCLKGYIQGGGNYVWQVIDCGDDGYHSFKAQAHSDDESQVDFYVDGNYKFTLSNPGSTYYGNWFYFVGTTHRATSGWGSSGEQVEMYSMTTF